MSELKAFEVTGKALFGSFYTKKVYDKDEADKAIAELKAQKDAKILALDAEVFKQKHHAKLFFDERNYAETQLRRQKYKRCLAMARWCDDAARLSTWDSDYHRCGWYNKWMQRWLKIAEKFKEGV